MIITNGLVKDRICASSILESMLPGTARECLYLTCQTSNQTNPTLARRRARREGTVASTARGKQTRVKSDTPDAVISGWKERGEKRKSNWQLANKINTTKGQRPALHI